jgi:hypothetical protein
MTKHDFRLHTVETAPEASRKGLADVKQKFGRVPNFFAVAAESPAAINAYVSLSNIFRATALTPSEQQIVILAASAENKCGYCVAAHDKAYDALDDRRSLEAVLERMPLLSFDRRSRSKVVATLSKGLLSSPYLSFKAASWLIRKLWLAKADLWAGRGRVNKLSFVIHDFMDACRLERDRVEACAFMVMIQQGPMSMCLHNAKRDAFILAPIRLSGPRAERWWDPLSGQVTEQPLCTDDVRDRRGAKERRKSATTAAVVR